MTVTLVKFGGRVLPPWERWKRVESKSVWARSQIHPGPWIHLPVGLESREGPRVPDLPA